MVSITISPSAISHSFRVVPSGSSISAAMRSRDSMAVPRRKSFTPFHLKPTVALPTASICAASSKNIAPTDS